MLWVKQIPPLPGTVLYKWAKVSGEVRRQDKAWNEGAMYIQTHDTVMTCTEVNAASEEKVLSTY